MNEVISKLLAGAWEVCSVVHLATNELGYATGQSFL